MADDCGRVNPVTPHFLNRGSREEPYQGRHSKKQQGHDSGDPVTETDAISEEDERKSAPGNHIDLRI